MNLLDHGAADTLGSIGAIMSGTSVPNTSRISEYRARRLRDRRKALPRGSGAGPASGSYYRIAWRSLCRCDQSVGDLLIELFRHHRHTFVAILTKEGGREVVFESCSASPVFVEDDP